MTSVIVTVVAFVGVMKLAEYWELLATLSGKIPSLENTSELPLLTVAAIMASLTDPPSVTVTTMVFVVEDDLWVLAWTSEVDDEVAVVAVSRGAAIAARAIDGLVATVRGSATQLDLVAGAGTATLGTGADSARFRLTLPADGSAVFVGR